MKKRVISATIFMMLWIAILIINSKIIDTVVVVLLSILGTYEYFKAFRNIRI